MCRKLIVHHSCTHKSAEIEQCTTVININKNRAGAANSWKWKREAPLPRCSRLRTDVPRCGYHYIWTSPCPSCRKKYGPSAYLDFILAVEEKQREIEALRCRVAKDIQQGKYVQQHPSLTPHSMVAPQKPSIPALERPAYGHKGLESKDFTDMGPDHIGGKSPSYHRSGEGSGMAFEHLDVAAHNDLINSQKSRRRAYDMGERLNKPLPLTPPNEREPIRRKPVPDNSSRQPFPKLKERERHAATRFEADHIHTRRPSPSRQRSTIGISFQGRSGESNPTSARSVGRASWPDPNDNARANLKPAPVVPQAPQIVQKPLCALDGVSPLQALSALVVESRPPTQSSADDYFVSSHDNNGKGKGKRMPSQDEVKAVTKQTPKVTVTRPGKSNRLEPSSLHHSADTNRTQTSHDDGKRFLARWSSLTPPPQPEVHNAQPAVGAGYLPKPSCPWTTPNNITGSPPLLSSAVYNPPPIPPPRDPTDDIAHKVDDVVDFETIEYRVNVMAAAAEVRTRVEKWQGSSATASHSRTHRREQNKAQRARGGNVLPVPLRIQTPLDMLNPAHDGKGRLLNQPD